MSDVIGLSIPVELVRMAIQVAEQRGQDVADVPVPVLAAAAGVSRSTLLRRLGGSRQALNEAVRAAGVDPGGRQPVRERAVAAAADLIEQQGLAAMTLDAVAVAAGCSVPSLYATFVGRDGLLRAVYESYTPLFDIAELLAHPDPELSRTVCAIYRALAVGFARQPRIAPALLADAFSRPDGPAARLVDQYFPYAVRTIGAWLTEEITAGRIHQQPVELLMQQLLGPILLHLLSHPLLDKATGSSSLDLDEVCTNFAEAFVRAVSSGGHDGKDASR